MGWWRTSVNGWEMVGVDPVGRRTRFHAASWNYTKRNKSETSTGELFKFKNVITQLIQIYVSQGNTWAGESHILGCKQPAQKVRVKGHILKKPGCWLKTIAKFQAQHTEQQAVGACSEQSGRCVSCTTTVVIFQNHFNASKVHLDIPRTFASGMCLLI